MLKKTFMEVFGDDLIWTHLREQLSIFILEKVKVSLKSF